MAIGKSRASKRPASGSCSSAATLMVFIFVSVFGIWMLTSSSFISPRKKKASLSTDHSIFDKEDLPRKIPITTTVFDDNPGELPGDAIKTDDDLEMDQRSIHDQDEKTSVWMEPKHGNEISKEKKDVVEEKMTGKNEQKQKANSTRMLEPDTIPLKRHNEKMITANISTENEDGHHRIKHEHKQPDTTKSDDDKGNEDNDHTVDDHEVTSSKMLNDSMDQKNGWKTQADQSKNQNEGKQSKDDAIMYKWELCNVTAGTDYIPCLDNEKAINSLHSRNHFEHRERHCPKEGPTCLVPLPEGYKMPIPWPGSRNKIWFHNVPHKALVKVKGHQNWVKATGEFLTFPGGGTQFIHGALHYINFIQQMVPQIAWGKHTRVILDVGCGVASFGGYLFDKNVLTLSFAPKDEHEAQIQFALERGIPAISAVMGTQRLPFPSGVFDLVHCARCRVPWHKEGGRLLMELNRVLRPGGYFVWSATPVYRKGKEDVQIWKEMSALTVAMCWKLITIKRDNLNIIGVAIYQKPDSNECYNDRKNQEPPMCKPEDDPDAAWYVPLKTCMHKVPIMETERGSQWPKEWPARVQMPPYWLKKNPKGIYGKPTPKDIETDYEHWKRVVGKTYMSGLEIDWSNVRNVMDMRAVYGGFAAALKDPKLWVMNVINIDSPDTLPIIYERGLFGIYHDWCESFSTYPRTYDLLHADHLFSKLKKRCKITPVIAEVDRIVRPGGKLIIRDKSSTIEEIENLLKSLHWDIRLSYSKKEERIFSAQKSTWRPKSYTIPS
uniref:probable methyltransferase PMT27 n=1 Tax=Erigeron canadensis TaxID=72917 RepID=UPI001CB93D6F|nr:probable methyltransferase PMT27 [Erigeron canadensis]